MLSTRSISVSRILPDLASGLIVFLVALPLCLGVALASNAAPFSGLLAGIVGGIVVGYMSQSQTSVSGPAAGLIAVSAAQIALLGSFQTFLLSVVLAGIIQIAMGLFRAGFVAAFIPSSVIKGLLAAIGVILILKQIPHLLGHHSGLQGDFAFQQSNQHNTFSQFLSLFGDVHPTSAIVGLISVLVLVVWDKWKPLRNSHVPAPVIVVVLGIGLTKIFGQFGGSWMIQGDQMVKVPVAGTVGEFIGFLQLPDFSQLMNPAVYVAAITLALVASLETLINIEAIDKIDPKRRTSPHSPELLAQGIGNVCSGLIGGLPITSVIARSSVNINSGCQTKLSTIVNGCVMLICVAVLPDWLNFIPLSCLAAILLLTGFKLASPSLFKQMWMEGRYQFVPFISTVVAIVLTDLVLGILMGLAVSICFILRSNMRQPLKQSVEKHLGGEVTRIELANQVSFLNRAVLDEALDRAPRGGHVLLDGRNTVYIDHDVLSLIRDFKNHKAPARGVRVSLVGFLDKFELSDEFRYKDHASHSIQTRLTPDHVLNVLKEGNARFRAGQHLTRDLGRQVSATSEGQFPLAVVLSCIDSRTPVELVFDLGLGDVFGVRVAGNITSEKVLGSLEYSCAVAGAKLIVVMGHTRCGAVGAAVKFACIPDQVTKVTGCQHLGHVIGDIQKSIDLESCRRVPEMSPEEKQAYIDGVATCNVLTVIQTILDQSDTIRKLTHEGRIGLVGAMYDVSTGEITFMQ